MKWDIERHLFAIEGLLTTGRKTVLFTESGNSYDAEILETEQIDTIRAELRDLRRELEAE